MAEGLSNPMHALAHEPAPADRPGFEITGTDGAVQTGTNGRVGVSVYPDGKSRMRKRNAIKWPGGRKIQWLFAELDDVRVYVHDEGGQINVVLTKQDLYP